MKQFLSINKELRKYQYKVHDFCIWLGVGNSEKEVFHRYVDVQIHFSVKPCNYLAPEGLYHLAFKQEMLYSVYRLTKGTCVICSNSDIAQIAVAWNEPVYQSVSKSLKFCVTNGFVGGFVDVSPVLVCVVLILWEKLVPSSL